MTIYEIRRAYDRWLQHPDEETTIADLLNTPATLMDALESQLTVEEISDKRMAEAIRREAKRPRPVIYPV